LDNKSLHYVVGPNQQQTHTFIFDERIDLTDAHLSFYVERDAMLRVNVLIVNVNACITINAILRGRGSDVRINGAYLLSANHKATITTVQHHHDAHTRSALVMKGALKDSAQAHYQGTIRVEKEAHGTNASQENKNILLSNNARAISVPNLEVLNNEVKCFHGSAVGRFDAQQLFYAACRGIDEKTAEKMLLNGFFSGLFENDLNEKIGGLIDGF
jgi:Fe-S cluster assembly protein SufD